MSLVATELTRRIDGVAHLDNISCTLERGRFYVVVGPTLSGKTSLLHALAGLDVPDTGRITLDDADLATVPVWSRSVSMVYQQFINYPHLSVYDNIAFPLRRRRFKHAEIERRVRAMAETVGLTPFLTRLPGALSGGQQQRVALARSLVKGSDLLLLDEPLINLDYKLREQLREEFLNIFSAQSRSIVVYTTADPNEALLFGAEVLVMHEGRLLQVGAAQSVYARPATATVARIFSDPPMNLLPGSLEDAGLRLSKDVLLPRPRHFGSLAQGPYVFGIHPSDIAPDPSGIASEVELAEISGSETFLHVRHADMHLVAHLSGVHAYALGENVHVALEGSKLFAFAPGGELAAAPAAGG
ncbi:MAG TPA: ABC transporter ATP-binding protein [Burkholderiales bacterium]|nr:ABC transporter ATP-binding protein [Burkholderiales bacterium]